MFSSLLVVASAFAQQPFHESALIFKPEPLHNHGSSIVETPEGDLLVCWFHGTGERQADDVQVLGARKRKGASEWSEPFLMADTPNLPDCNPVLFIDPRGTLWLFWITVQDNEWGGSLLKYRRATSYQKDGPPDWEWQDVIHCRPQELDRIFFEALAATEKKYVDYINSNEGLKEDIAAIKVRGKEKLTQRLGWMTRLHPIMLSETRMMLGLYSDVFNCSLAAFTEDWGTTWQFSKPIIGEDLGNIQPSFVKRRDNAIVAYMRDNGPPKQIRKSVSEDNGISWSPVESTDIPNPGSSLECISLANGHWVMVCNDTKRGRHLVTAYLSDDEGQTWKWKRALEAFEPEQGSGAYPSVIQAKDGAIHCTYSYRSKEFPAVDGRDPSTIKHVRFNEAWIMAGE